MVVRAVVVVEDVVVVVGGLWEASRWAWEGAASLPAGRTLGAAVSPSMVAVVEVVEVVEVRVGNVLGSRARVAAARGALESRSEGREVERLAEAAASRRARNSARRAALRRRSEGARRRAGRAASPPPGAPGGW